MTALVERVRIQNAISGLRDVEEYFAQRADVDDGIPNEAMHLMTDVQRAIKTLQEAFPSITAAMAVDAHVRNLAKRDGRTI